jgi:hypothetical protein
LAELAPGPRSGQPRCRGLVGRGRARASGRFVWGYVLRQQPSGNRPSVRTRLAHPWHNGGSLSNPIRSPNHAGLHKYWWARTVSNRRPLVCKETGSSERVFYGVQRVQVSDVSRVPVISLCPQSSVLSWDTGGSLANRCSARSTHRCAPLGISGTVAGRGCITMRMPSVRGDAERRRTSSRPAHR